METLDAYFKNVVELDIVFNFHKVRIAAARTHVVAANPVPPPHPSAPGQVYAIVDEIITGGEIIESSKREMMASIADVDQMEKASS